MTHHGGLAIERVEPGVGHGGEGFENFNDARPTRRIARGFEIGTLKDTGQNDVARPDPLIVSGRVFGQGITYHGYSKGTSARETGVLTAAFAGHHGWFWRNRSGERVTITLQTSGDYESVDFVD